MSQYMIQFYAPDIQTTLTLPESDSQHAVKVLRLREGDTLDVIDGRGNRYSCRLVAAHPKHAAVEIVATEHVALYWEQHITVGVAPTKHLDRMEWMVEKLTEIGVNSIVPLLCDRSERKEIKVERLQKIAVAAMKQSLKAFLPKISPMTPIEAFLTECSANQRFIAYCDPAIPRHELVAKYRSRTDTAIIIGPEGDFSPREIEYALAGGWQPVTLGDNRLRTETAAIVACDTFHIIDEYNKYKWEK